VHAKRDHVRGTAVRNVILRQLKAWDDEHSVALPRANGLGAQNFEIDRKRGGRERSSEPSRGLAGKRCVLAKVIRDRDRAEAATPVQINDLRNREFSVAE